MREGEPDNVVPFERNPGTEIEEILKHLQERARRGELAGLAVAAIGSDHQVLSAHAGNMGHRNILMNGLLYDLQREINRITQ